MWFRTASTTWGSTPSSAIRVAAVLRRLWSHHGAMGVVRPIRLSRAILAADQPEKLAPELLSPKIIGRCSLPGRAMAASMMDRDRMLGTIFFRALKGPSARGDVDPDRRFSVRLRVR